jgi:hypothetical protein
MAFEDYIKLKRNVILGYYLFDSMGLKGIDLETPYPPATLTEEQLLELKDKLNEFMPVYSMIIDLWDWDVHFEDYLSEDWYFEAVFGDDKSIDYCAENLAEFFLEQVVKFDLDYDQFGNEDFFEELVLEESKKFIVEWRENIFEKLRN